MARAKLNAVNRWFIMIFRQAWLITLWCTSYILMVAINMITKQACHSPQNWRPLYQWNTTRWYVCSVVGVNNWKSPSIAMAKRLDFPNVYNNDNLCGFHWCQGMYALSCRILKLIEIYKRIPVIILDYHIFKYFRISHFEFKSCRLIMVLQHNVTCPSPRVCPSANKNVPNNLV